MRVLRADVLEDRQTVEIPAHAVQDDEVRTLLICNYPRLVNPALVQRDGPCPIVRLQVTADILKVRRVG
jgi:hypothetical protein